MSFEYLEAAKALKKVLDGNAGLKTAIFDANSRNVKRVYAIVMECAKRRAELEAAVGTCGLKAAAQEQAVDYCLLLIMCYELLYGAGKIKGGGKVKRLIKEYEAALRTASGVPERAPSELGARLAGATPSALASVAAELAESSSKVRHARVNTLKTSIEAAISSLCDPKQSATGNALDRKDIEINAHIPTVISLPPHAHRVLELHSHPLVTSGSLILQDLASAMPAHALLAGPLDWLAADGGASGGSGSSTTPQRVDLIDACAAPGNKTSQLAALLAAITPGSGPSASSSSVAASASSAPSTTAAATSSSSSSSSSGGRQVAVQAAPGQGQSRKAKKRAKRRAAAGAAGAAEGNAADDADADADGDEAAASAVPASAAPLPPVSSSSSSTSSSSGHNLQGGSVFAFDRDPNRLDLLKRRMGEAGAETFVQSTCADFLSIDPTDFKYANVKAVLLDPSCSGSGMKAQSHIDGTGAAAAAAASAAPATGGDAPAAGGAGSKKRKLEETADGPSAAASSSTSSSSSSSSQYQPPEPLPMHATRVKNLSEFQKKALLHALSFPSVKRVVYSTCSVYVQEDEAVVAHVLSTHNEKAAACDDGSVRPVRLVNCLPSWHRRGVAAAGLSAAQAACCVRCDPAQDATTGFFVALFEKQ